MEKYKIAHLWEFPPTRTFVCMNDKPRKAFFEKLLEKSNSKKIIDILNSRCVDYGLKLKLGQSRLWEWKNGNKNDRGRNVTINIPLWALIEMSKIISETDYLNILSYIEKNLKYYTGRGRAKSVYNPIMPLVITPELVSIVFHLCGDGHVGIGTDPSNYRQVNHKALNNFVKKLRNSFGYFDVKIFEDSKIIIPRVITDFYTHYFELNNLNWDVARIPKKIKNMPKEFLIAGLASFIVDEGHISDVIEIYSKNKDLIEDVKEIAVRLGYKVHGPKEKYRYGKLDSYRIYISAYNANEFYDDILTVSVKFPTCTLVHKMPFLYRIVLRQKRGYSRKPDGVTKKKIVKLLKVRPRTTIEIAEILNIGHSSVREHIDKLEGERKIRKLRRAQKRALIFEKLG